ncbi:MAG: tetratricopeptide repeat protein, partial [Cyclobacteriaceae bacterium]|nr:tetratricopeptide repeat protein [Cyclobacteriaceae bacterium]
AFLFLAFFSYLKTTASGNRKEFYRWLFLSIISYLAATLVNPPAIILPVLILFYDIFSRRKIFSREIFPGYIGMGCVVLLIITINYYIFPTEYIGAYADDFTAFLTLISNLGQYFFVMISPLSLHTPHEYTVYSTTNLRFILSVFFLLGLLVYFVKGLRRKSWYAFGIGWFYIGLIPSITLWKNPASFGERYALYSSFGFSLITAMLIQNITRYFPKITTSKITWKYISESVVVLMLIFYSAVLIGRNNTWRNTENLMLDTLKKSPGNVFANKTLSDYYITVKKTPEKAIPVVKSSIEIHENKLTQMVIPELRNAEQIYIAELRERLGNAYRESGQIDLAIREHEKSMKLVPQRNLPYFFLGLDYDSLADLWEKKGKPDFVTSNLEKALFYYEESFARNPKHSVAYFNGGLALFRLGRIDECINMIEKGLAFSPYNFKALGILARAYMQNKQYKKAVTLLRESIKQAEERGEEAIVYELKRQLIYVNAILGIDSDEKVQLPESEVSLEDKFVLLFSQEKYEEALKVALEMRIKPEHPDAKLINNIGLCYYKLNRYEEAEKYYQKSIELDPNYEVPYYNLSLIYVKTGQIEKAIEMCKKALSINPEYEFARSKLEFYKNVKKAINQVK